MRQGYRQRAAAVASAAVLGGVPLLLIGAAPAYAETDPPAVPESGREVVFDGGGLGVLSCGSQPSVGRLAVPAESTVRFVNKLNQAATLRLDGRDAARLARGGVRPVLFHRGPVRVELVPDCLANVNSKYGAVSVEVTKAAPGKSGSPGSTGGSGSGGPTSGSTGGGTAPGRDPGVPAATTPTNPDGTPANGVPSTPNGQSSPGVAGAPTDGGSPSANGATVDETASQAGTDGWAAEPVAAAAPIGDSGPIGLLALIAAVCVIGVSVGTIRAIITQRATRSSYA
jgi:hypothetical protein